jgi:hypothetical protein
MNHPVPRHLLSPAVLFQALPPLRDLGDKEKGGRMAGVSFGDDSQVHLRPIEGTGSLRPSRSVVGRKVLYGTSIAALRLSWWENRKFSLFGFA